MEPANEVAGRPAFTKQVETGNALVVPASTAASSPHWYHGLFHKTKVDTERALGHRDSAEVDWADHFWDVYKYRHETWWRTFYRSIWIIGVLAVTPWIPWIKDYPIITNPRGRVAYGLAPLVFFLLLVIPFLTVQFQERRLAEYRLDVSRGIKPKDFLEWAAFSEKGTRWKTWAFIISMVVAWLVWFCFLMTSYRSGSSDSLV